MRLATTAFTYTLTLIILAGAAVGLSDDNLSVACGKKHKPNVRFIWAYTDDDGVVNDLSRDPDDDGVDPGYDKEVAECEAELYSHKFVVITIKNGYPSYTCRFWTKYKNTGSRTVKRWSQVISASDALTVTPLATTGPVKLKPGQWRVESFSVHVEQSAGYQDSYHFAIENRFIVVKKACGKCW